MKTKKIPISKARNGFNRLAKEVAENGASVIIEFSGEAYVAIIPMQEYKLLEEARVIYSAKPYSYDALSSVSDAEVIPRQGIFKFFNKGVLPEGVRVEDVEKIAKKIKSKKVLDF